MTRDDIIKIFPDATEEQLKPILDMNSADIGKALNKQKAELDTANADLKTARETIDKLQKASGDVDALKTELAKFKADEKKREEEAAAKAVDDALSARFKAVSEKTNFVNEYTRDAVYAQFKAAVSDTANAGKGDSELFSALIAGKNDIIANPNPGINISGPKNIDNAILTTEAFKSLPLAEKMKWANANPDAYAKMSEMLKE